MRISFSNLFFALASVMAMTAILWFGKPLLVPICFAALFAFILYPLVKWLNRIGLNKILAIALSIFGVIVVVLGVIFVFSTQIIRIAGEYSNFLDKMRATLEESVTFLNENIQVIPTIRVDNLVDQLEEFFSDSSFLIISDTVSFTTSFLTFLILTFTYAFLILFYSEHITESLCRFSPKIHRGSFKQMLKEVQKVGQEYFVGMILLIIILGILNSVGLLIIGIDYPFFFGFLAALLAIIPYVGTTLGGLIPTLYALIAYDSYLYPIGVIGVFWFIQFVEGNFLSPKIVGGNMQINALFAIFSLIAGGVLWGIPGMILFLPLVAILKVICSHYEELKPVASLIGERIHEVEEVELNSYEKLMKWVKKKR